MSHEFPIPGQCPHGRNFAECAVCLGEPKPLRLQEAAQFLSNTNISFGKDQNLIDTVGFLVDDTHIAGLGLFVSGSFQESDRERSATKQIADHLEEAGANVLILPIDKVLLDQSTRTIGQMILDLGEKTYGARDEPGKPQAILITGFTQSVYLTDVGLQAAIEQYTNSGFKDEKYTLIMKRILSEKTPGNILSSLSVEERAIVAAMLLGYRCLGDWQRISRRKSGKDHQETPIVINIGPLEAFEVINVHATGQRRPNRTTGGESDFVFRCKEGMSNF